MDVRVPEMIIKLKQGIGRLIRNFTDTGIVCIIDRRLRDEPPERLSLIHIFPPTSNANYGWILNIGSKLSQNGVAGFLLANGALSDDGTELKIRRQLIENNLVEAIIILPRNLFYTTDISVTLWICLLYTSRCV